MDNQIISKDLNLVERDSEGFKKDCKWRNELTDVCSFKAHQCHSVLTPDGCDMFDIPFEIEAIQEKIKQEKEVLSKLVDEMQEMKKNGEHKTNKKLYEKKAREKYDKFCGITYLAQAEDNLSGNKFSRWCAKYPRLAKKFQAKALKKLEEFKKKQEDKLRETDDKPKK